MVRASEKVNIPIKMKTQSAFGVASNDLRRNYWMIMSGLDSSPLTRMPKLTNLHNGDDQNHIHDRSIKLDCYCSWANVKAGAHETLTHQPESKGIEHTQLSQSAKNWRW